MNPGILTESDAAPPMPYGLLGRPAPVVVPDGAYHPDALDWRQRVAANGGSVSPNTMRAVNELCATVDAIGVRDRFYRLNLFVGSGLSAALVPLYRGPSLAGPTFGNRTDTNINFVSADYNETGRSSGLQGNGSNKSLNTGVLANSLTPSNTHLALGLQSPETRGEGGGIGTFDGGSRAWGIYIRNLNFPFSTFFTRYDTATDRMGESTTTSSLAVGNIIASWPTFFRDGRPSGARATTAGDYPSAHAFIVFGIGNAVGATGTSVLQQTLSRINWYSIGLGFTQWQAWAFSNAMATFNARLLRT